MKTKHLLLILLLLSGYDATASDAKKETIESDKALDLVVKAFADDFKDLKIPEFGLSYVDNFKKIQSRDGLDRQSVLFAAFSKKLERIDRKSLSDDKRYDYDNLAYFIKLNQERLTLEKRFRETNSPTIENGAGIYALPDGAAWYRYYLKAWASKEITPKEVTELGESEVRNVRSALLELQNQLGYVGKDAEFYQHLNSSVFFIDREDELQIALKALRGVVASKLGTDFGKTDVPVVDIKPIDNPNKDTPPGYYDSGVFYYNFFGHHFNRRAMSWLFIHEAIPGHHYQGKVAPDSPLAKTTDYPGFTEGWGAYAEDLGKDVGAYEDPYASVGKFEWDLVRSARLVMDVGLNAEGWTKEKALQYWHDNIPNQDAIAEREIDRMIRWPGQVVSYKVGEREFLKLRGRVEEARGSSFDLKAFHTAVLKRGAIPLPVLDQVIEDQISEAKNKAASAKG